MKNLLKNFIRVLFVIYVLYLATELFIENREHGAFYTDYSTYLNLRTNFVPFHTINNYLLAMSNHNINTSTFVLNILGNLIAFAPFGFFMPILFARFRSFWWFLLFVFGSTIAVEIIQVLLKIGSCDIDDVILNVTGAVLIYMVMYFGFIRKIFSKIGLVY